MQRHWFHLRLRRHPLSALHALPHVHTQPCLCAHAHTRRKSIVGSDGPDPTVSRLRLDRISCLTLLFCRTFIFETSKRKTHTHTQQSSDNTIITSAPINANVLSPSSVDFTWFFWLDVFPNTISYFDYGSNSTEVSSENPLMTWSTRCDLTIGGSKSLS